MTARASKEQELTNFDTFLSGRSRSVLSMLTTVRPSSKRNVRSYLIDDPKSDNRGMKALSDLKYLNRLLL